MIYSRPQRVIHKHMHISVVFLLFCFYVKKGRFLGLNAGFHLGFTKLPTKLILILLLVNLSTYRVLIKYFFFPRILDSLPPFPRQHSAAIGCTKNYSH